MSTVADPLTTNIDLGDLKEYLRIKATISELNTKVSALRTEASTIEGRLTEQFATNGVQSMNCNGSTWYLNER